MRTLINVLRRAPKRVSAVLTMVAAAVVVPAALFAWGPDRPTFTVAKPADHVTFNSITNNPQIGDERNFVNVKDAANTQDGGWQDTVTVEPGKEYLVRVYVHNNAAANLNLKALNTRVSASVPTTTGTSVSVSGFVSADNATPAKIWDDIHFNSTQQFNLAYVGGSARIYNNGYAKGGNGQALPDSIVTNTGALIGYNGPDGTVPGCFEFENYVYFKVKPQFAPAATPGFSVNKEVRKDGEKTFVESVNAKSGDKLNYRVVFNNTGKTQLNNVSLKDTLPKGITNVPGTVRIMNANNPGGAYIKDGDKLFTTGTNIGAYTAGSNAIVIFDAKVGANDTLPTCGKNTLRNIAKAQPEGQTAKEDGADVIVNKTCVEQPKNIQVCDLTSKKVITIKETAFDNKKHSKNLDDCKPTVPGEINVCDLKTKKVVTITEAAFDSNKHSKNLQDCVVTPTTPVTPAELPQTGPAETILSVFGLGSLIAASAYYIASRRALN